MSKPFMVISAPVATRSGYGEHARDLVHSLLSMDRYDISIISTRWGNTPMNALNYEDEQDKKIVDLILKEKLDKQPDIFVQVTVANEFQPVGKFNIGITAGIESTGVPHEWIEGVNRMNLVIVPSNHSKDIFTNTVFTKADKNTGQALGTLKVERPIEVLFEGADIKQYGIDNQGNPVNGMNESIDSMMTDINEKFCFLFVGHWLPGELGQDRKNVGMLIKTFYTVFQGHPNPPALVLKTNLVDFSVLDREEILNRIRSIRETFSKDQPLPSVYVVHGDLTTSEMNSLYTHPKVKSHISFTKGEGFGRPLLEASLSGKPVITTNWSGHLDFLDKESAVLLDGSLEHVHETAANQFLLKETKWFNINISQAAVKMNDMYANYDRFAENAKKLMQRNRKKFSMDKMNEKFAEILSAHIKLPEQIKIKLPKVKLAKTPEKKVEEISDGTTGT